MHREWAVVALWLALAGCADRHDAADARRPQQAGQPMDPVATAARIAAIRGAAIVGDQDAIRGHMDAMQDDYRRAIKLPDPGRRIDPESARAVIRDLPWVRSTVWMDRGNLVAMVSGPESRSQRAIDEICMRLEPLGDTLGVVVHLQDTSATTGEELAVLSRNCQLQPGDRSFMHRDRAMDVVPAHVREQQRKMQAGVVIDDERRRRRAENMRLLEDSTPEM